MLKFDVKAMVDDLNKVYLYEIEVLTDWLWAQVQAKAPPEVRRDMIGKEIKIIGNQVIGTVWAGGIGALTTEWGSGSLADESNPAWETYTQSKYYNPSRFSYGHPISGRPKGSYINLDNEIKYSSGRMEGLNLERWLPPREPQHWLREIVQLSRPYVVERLLNVVQTFPFYKYITDGR